MTLELAKIDVYAKPVGPIVSPIPPSFESLVDVTDQEKLAKFIDERIKNFDVVTALTVAKLYLLSGPVSSFHDDYNFVVTQIRESLKSIGASKHIVYSVSELAKIMAEDRDADSCMHNKPPKVVTLSMYGKKHVFVVTQIRAGYDVVMNTTYALQERCGMYTVALPLSLFDDFAYTLGYKDGMMPMISNFNVPFAAFRADGSENIVNPTTVETFGPAISVPMPKTYPLVATSVTYDCIIQAMLRYIARVYQYKFIDLATKKCYPGEASFAISTHLHTIFHSSPLIIAGVFNAFTKALEKMDDQTLMEFYNLGMFVTKSLSDLEQHDYNRSIWFVPTLALNTLSKWKVYDPFLKKHVDMYAFIQFLPNTRLNESYRSNPRDYIGSSTSKSAMYPFVPTLGWLGKFNVHPAPLGMWYTDNLLVKVKEWTGGRYYTNLSDNDLRPHVDEAISILSSANALHPLPKLFERKDVEDPVTMSIGITYYNAWWWLREFESNTMPMFNVLLDPEFIRAVSDQVSIEKNQLNMVIPTKEFESVVEKIIESQHTVWAKHGF
ncbi:MAG: hypothetical protein JZD41_02600 [Thermoproteus sp.]|nr:hypothetical protein [Thermoproteus sp.]